jgi:hypothetical protein
MGGRRFIVAPSPSFARVGLVLLHSGCCLPRALVTNDAMKHDRIRQRSLGWGAIAASVIGDEHVWGANVERGRTRSGWRHGEIIRRARGRRLSEPTIGLPCGRVPRSSRVCGALELRQGSCLEPVRLLALDGWLKVPRTRRRWTPRCPIGRAFREFNARTNCRRELLHRRMTTPR